MGTLGNATEISELHVKKFFDLLAEGAKVRLTLLDVQSFNSVPIFSYYVQPILATLYIIFIVFMLIVFRKLQMMVFVQIILLVCTFTQILPYFAVIPINVVFFHFAREQSPMPFPWCYIYSIAFDAGLKVTRLTDVYLKVLIAVNRFCSVYFPFQTRQWFSKSRSVAMTVTVYIVILIIGSGCSYPVILVKKMVTFADLWTKGDYRVYSACSFTRVLKDAPNIDGINLVFVIEFLLLLLGSFILVLLNAAVIIEIKRKEKKRRDLMGPKIKTNEKSYQNVFKLSKVVTWILSLSLLAEVPMLAIDVMNFYVISIGVFEGYPKQKLIQNVNDILVDVSITGQFIIIPLYLVVFLMFSKRTRSGIKSLVCKQK